MKALIVSREYPSAAEGGISQRLLKIVPRLLDAGVEVGAVTFAESSIDGEVMYPVVAHSKILYTHAGEPNLLDFAAIINDIWRLDRYAAAIAAERGYDVIHIEEPVFGPFVRSPLPTLVTVHNTQAGESLAYSRAGSGLRQLRRVLFSGTFGYGFDGLCFRECDRVVAVSPSVKRQLMQYYRMSPEKIEVVPNGVEMPEGLLDKASARDRIEPGGQPGTLLIVCVGRLVDHKRVDVLLSALAKTKMKGIRDFRCYIVGTGPSENDLRLLSQRLSLQKEVEFTGFVSDERLRSLLSAAEVVVSPSSYEGWGMAVLEAASYGCAPVVSAIPAFKANLTDGVDSLLFSPGDAAELAERLELLYGDRGLLKRIQAGARQLAGSMNWGTSVAKLVALYGTMTGHKRLEGQD